MNGKDVGLYRLIEAASFPLLSCMIGLIGLLVLAGCTAGSSGTNPGTHSPIPLPSDKGGGPGIVKDRGEEPGASGAANKGGKEADAAEDTIDAVAIVGGKTITRSELTERLMTGYGAELLRDLMLREAVTREAASLGVTVTDEELARELRKMSEGYGSDAEFYASMLRQLGMDREAVREDARYHLLLEKLATWNVRIEEPAIRQYYEDHPQEFGPHVEYELSWILTNEKADANRVLAELENGVDFDDAAKRYSLDGATADQGGELGWVDERDPFQSAKLLTAAGQLEVGEIAGPLQMDPGYAVLRLNGKKTLQGKAYEDVRDEIRRQLAMEQARPMQELQRALLDKYGAKVLDPGLIVPDAE